MTKAAVSGGTTFLLEEPSFYENASIPDELYCDLATVKVLSDTNMSSPDDGYIAYKAYLFQPSASVPAISNIDQALELTASKGMTLLIDPNFPDPRMLYMASPLRLENAKSRENNTLAPTAKVYAAAFSDNNEDSNKSESEESEESLRTTSLTEHVIDTFKPKTSFDQNEYELTRYSKDVQIELRTSDPELVPPKSPNRRGSGNHPQTIFDNLDQRIKEDQKSIELLCLAEKNTYQHSGSTSFTETLPEEEKPKVRKRPGALNISTPKVDLQPDYTFFLANCPES